MDMSDAASDMSILILLPVILLVILLGLLGLRWHNERSLCLRVLYVGICFVMTLAAISCGEHQ